MSKHRSYDKEINDLNYINKHYLLTHTVLPFTTFIFPFISSSFIYHFTLYINLIKN